MYIRYRRDEISTSTTTSMTFDIEGLWPSMSNNVTFDIEYLRYRHTILKVQNVDIEWTFDIEVFNIECYARYRKSDTRYRGGKDPDGRTSLIQNCSTLRLRVCSSTTVDAVSFHDIPLSHSVITMCRNCCGWAGPWAGLTVIQLEVVSPWHSGWQAAITQWRSSCQWVLSEWHHDDVEVSTQTLVLFKLPSESDLDDDLNHCRCFGCVGPAGVRLGVHDTRERRLKK